MKAQHTEKTDKRAAALRDNLKRRKLKTKQTKEQTKNAKTQDK